MSTPQRGKRIPDGSVQVVDAERVELEPLSMTEVKSVHKRILELKQGIELNYLEIGELLYKINKCSTRDGTRLFFALGYDSFDDYCEKALGFYKRKGYHLSSIYKNTIEGPLPRKAVETMGWSKASLVVPLVEAGIINKNNADKWLKRLDGKNFDEIRVMMKLAREKSKEKDKGSSSGGNSTPPASPPPDSSDSSDSSSSETSPEEVHILRVGLYKDQWENAQVAIKKARALTKSDKLPWNLDCIFLAFNSEAFSTRDQALDEICRRIERVFSVEIIALNSKTKKVAFGEALAKMIMASKKKEK